MAEQEGEEREHGVVDGGDPEGHTEAGERVRLWGVHAEVRRLHRSRVPAHVSPAGHGVFPAEDRGGCDGGPPWR